MGKLQYFLIMAIGFGLISQTIQQYDDDHFPHPDTRHGPKRQVDKDNHSPNSNHPFPENDHAQKKRYTDVPPPANNNDRVPGDLPPVDHQIVDDDHFPHHIPNWPDNDYETGTNLPPNIVPQFDQDRVPDDHWPNNDAQKKPLPSRVRRQIGDNLPDNHADHIPPRQMGKDNTPPPDNGLKRQIGWPNKDNFPGKNIRNNHFPTPTPPRHLNNLADVNEGHTPIYAPPIDHQTNDGHPHPDISPKKKDGQFPRPNDFDNRGGSPKDNILPTRVPPIPTYVPFFDHQIGDDDHFPHPDTRTGPKKKDGHSPDTDDRWPEVDDSQRKPINHQLSEDHLVNTNSGSKKRDADFPSPDDFDRKTGNGNDVKGNSVFDTPRPPITRATCLGWNGGSNCRKKCQKMKDSDTGRCYCTGSCEWSNLILTCKCKKPTCSC